MIAIPDGSASLTTAVDEGIATVVAAPLCVRVKVWPAMVNVPVRGLSVLEETENPTVPLPLPPLPERIVIQFALLVAVHAQPALASTLTLPCPPPTAID